jgi:hypothetical protein
MKLGPVTSRIWRAAMLACFLPVIHVHNIVIYACTREGHGRLSVAYSRGGALATIARSE